MAVGDSITAGYKRPSYRQSLLDELSASGCTVDMVGDQTLNSFHFRNPLRLPGSHYPGFTPALGYDTDHQAFGALRADELLNGASSSYYTVLPIARYIARYQPDFVLLHIGTNDLAVAISSGIRTSTEINNWANQTTGEVNRIISRIIASHNNPADLRILVSNFIPYRGPFVNQSQIDAAKKASALYSRKLEAMVTSRRDPRVLLVDVATGFSLTRMTVDNVHPNALGEQHITGAILPVLMGAGLCSRNKPTITTPSNGSVVNGKAQTIVWDANGSSVDRWRVYVGDKQSGDSSSYFDSGVLGARTRRVEVKNLPEDGSSVYVSLNYRSGGIWNQVMTSFTSARGGNNGGGGGDADAAESTLLAPLPGTTLDSGSVRFEWSVNSSQVREWYFRIGSASSPQLYASRRISNSTQRSAVFTGLPTDGRQLYVQFSSRLADGSWVRQNFQYTAHSAASIDPPVVEPDGEGPVIVSPVPGRQLSGANVDFWWVDGGVKPDQWYLRAGLSPGSTEFENVRITNRAARRWRVSGLPTSGVPVYIEFSYRIGNTWNSRNFEYQSAGGGGSSDPSEPNGNSRPALVSPLPGSRLSGSTAVFRWSDNGTKPDQWYIRIGSSAGRGDILSRRITNPAVKELRASGLPTNGNPLYVNLAYLKSGKWVRQTFQYQAASR